MAFTLVPGECPDGDAWAGQIPSSILVSLGIVV